MWLIHQVPVSRHDVQEKRRLRELEKERKERGKCSINGIVDLITRNEGDGSGGEGGGRNFWTLIARGDKLLGTAAPFKEMV